MFGPRGDTVIRVLTIVSLVSALNAYQLMTPRVLYRLSTFGFFSAGRYVNRGGTPAVALWLSTAVILALVLTGTVQIVLAVTAFFFVAQYALAFLSLFILRRKEPDTPRPFRAKGTSVDDRSGVALFGRIFDRKRLGRHKEQHLFTRSWLLAGRCTG